LAILHEEREIESSDLRSKPVTRRPLAGISRASRPLCLLAGFGQGVAAFALGLLIFVGYGCLNNRWYRVVVIYSDSMSPALRAGDAIIITPAPAKLQPGMIVTFEVAGDLVTHRIVDISDDGCIVTKGDANEQVDHWTDARGRRIQLRGVAGIYRARIPYLGHCLALPGRVLGVLSTRAELLDQETVRTNEVVAGAWDPHPSAPILRFVEIGGWNPDAGAELSLLWESTSEHAVDHYNVYRWTETDSLRSLVDWGGCAMPSAESCVDKVEVLSYDQLVCYAVSAVDAGHESPYSNELCATTPGRPTPTPTSTPTSTPTLTHTPTGIPTPTSTSTGTPTSTASPVPPTSKHTVTPNTSPPATDTSAESPVPAPGDTAAAATTCTATSAGTPTCTWMPLTAPDGDAPTLRTHTLF